MEGMAALRRALNTDLSWVREHTRLLGRAQEWAAAGRVGNRMLAGSDIVAAKEWMARQPRGAPPPTELQKDFIAASEQAESARLSTERKRAETLQKAVNRTRVALAIALLLALLATGAGVIARQKEKQATASELRAKDQEAKAKKARDEALVVQSQHLADLAHEKITEKDFTTAMLLALAALPDPDGKAGAEGRNSGERPYVSDAEMRLLESYMGNHERVVIAHQSGVLCVAVTGDGSRVATGTSDGVVRIWDAATGAKVKELVPGHQGPVNGLAFSSDGSKVLSASADKTARVWDLGTGRFIKLEHPGSALSVAISLDNRRIATGSEDTKARLWDAQNGKLITELAGHSGPVVSVALNGKGSTVVTGSSDGKAKVWDATDGRVIASFEGHKLAVTSVALSMDGSQTVSGSFDGTSVIWETSTGKKIVDFKRAERSVSGVAFLPDSTFVLSGWDDSTVQVWDKTTGQTVQVYSGYLDAVTGLAVSADGRLVVAGSRDKTARLWDTSTMAEAVSLSGHSKAVSGVALSKDGKVAVTGSADGTAIIWDAVSRKKGAVLSGHSGEISSVALSEDASKIVTGSHDGAVFLWDRVSSRLVRRFEAHVGKVFSVAINPAATVIAAGYEDKWARTWDTTSGTQLKTFGPHVGRVTSLGFAASGQRLVTGAGTSARVWDAASATLQALLKHSSSVLAVAIEGSGRLVATGGRDPDVLLWQVPDAAALQGKSPDGAGQLKFTLGGHTGSVTALAFTDDGKRLVSVTDDGSVRIWRAESGTLVGLIDPAGHGLTSVALSSQSGQAILGSDAGTAYLTGVFREFGPLVRSAKADAAHCLTLDQLTKFHLGQVPPRWCITGAAKEADADLRNWRPKWPYQSSAWRDWLAAMDKGQRSDPPDSHQEEAQ
jgi:WD40 repeat protein